MNRSSKISARVLTGCTSGNLRASRPLQGFKCGNFGDIPPQPFATMCFSMELGSFVSGTKWHRSSATHFPSTFDQQPTSERCLRHIDFPSCFGSRSTTSRSLIRLLVLGAVFFLVTSLVSLVDSDLRLEVVAG